ncbi:hypothetical protein AVEN_140740-1 [Araneus ventricosus]|uniref:MATH domain-containing protein n=1 Tax=Araneus ventricosus TaxID=182803 RepID=A0A4Y2UQX9_ARAVE|nr:hypothetical protein AVEN_140740-1 [Araneus ventricosus]
MYPIKAGNGTFKVIWRLENFSYATQKDGESLPSPTFVLDTPLKTKWHLEVYPRGKTDSRFISCYLKREDHDECPAAIVMSCQYSILDKYGWHHYFVQIDNETIGHRNIVGVNQFVNRSEIFQYKDIFLPQDTLKVCFRVWDIQLSRSVQCEMHTLFGIEKRSFLWTIDNFRQRQLSGQWQTVIPSTSDRPIELKMIFATKSDSEYYKRAKIGIKCNSECSIFLVCEIFSVDMEGKSQLLASDDHFFWKKEFWALPPFTEVSQLFISENLFQNDGTLLLRCVITLSDGVKLNYIVSSICDEYFPEFGY